MAEIEHYVDPLDKVHPRFNEVKDVKLRLLAKDVQLDGRTDLTEMTIGDAVAKVCSRRAEHDMWGIADVQRIVDNETLGYFLARTYLFLTKIGIDPERLRCRQHMANEMAHYAAVSPEELAILPSASPLTLTRTAGTLRFSHHTAGSNVLVAPTDRLTT